MEIVIKSWAEASQDAYLIRKQVFVQEQGVPEELELDEFDSSAQHILVYQGDACIATARLVKLDDACSQIGRMAVLSPFRRQGIGMAILRALIDLAKREQISSLVLHSQVIAIPFYEKLGFKGDGPFYDEAGILHRNMMLSLANVLL